MRSCLALLIPALVLSSAHAATAVQSCDGSGQSGASLSAEEAAFSAHASRQDECFASGHGGVSGRSTYPYTIRQVVDAPLDFASCPDGEMYAAIEYRSIRFEGDEGIVLYNDFACVPYGSVDPEPVTPPASGTVWDVVRESLPMPVVRLSPGEKGLVGLETWFWADPAADGLQPVDHDGDAATLPRWGLTLTAEVVGIATTATVWIDEYRWTVDDGLTLTSTRPGTEEQPAAAHTYQRKGERPLVAATVWRGSWESPLGGGTLGPAELAGTPHPYVVHEIRAVPADG